MEFLDQAGQWLEQARYVYFAMAVVGSTFFAIQVFLMLTAGIGLDADAGSLEINTDGVECHDFASIEGLKIFSLKGLISFITFFGWAGFFWGGTGWPGFFAALGCGALMMLLTALVLWFLLQMQQSGNLVAEDMVGRSGTVYLGIGAGRRVRGTVTVQLPHCTRQIAAVADEDLNCGTPVVVKAALEEGLFLVEAVVKQNG